MLKWIFTVSVSLVILFWGGVAQNAVAQSATRLECGAIIESEFTDNLETDEYVIALSPGDTLTISGRPLGDLLHFSIGLYGPTGIHIVRSRHQTYGAGYVVPDPSIISGVISARGDYIIKAGNSELRENGTLVSGSSRWGGVGIYTLFVGCTLRDGTIIEPGQRAPETLVDPAIPTFSGTGFPGLPPIDFTNGVTIPFMAGIPNAGSLSPGFEGVFGFTLDVNAGETYSFDFTRVTGNLNLGITILSADNQVVFYGGMIASNRLSTDVTFPASGQYTIGVFRVDLLPPAAPENTAFQVMATLAQ